MTLDQQIDERIRKLCPNSSDNKAIFCLKKWLIEGAVWMRRDYPNFGLSEDFVWMPGNPTIVPIHIQEITGFTT